VKPRFVLVVILGLAACGLLFNPLGPTTPAYASVKQLTRLSGGVLDFQLSPNGQWVLFRLYRGGVVSLYSVSIQGGPPKRLAYSILNYARFSNQKRRMFVISPDSQRVLYFGVPTPTPTPTPVSGGPYVEYPGFGLYSVPIDGSTGSSVVADDANVHAFGFSPDSQRAIYASGTGTSTMGETYRFELFSKPIAGGAAERLNIDLPAGQSVAFDKISILHSGYVVYGVGGLNYNPPSGPSIGSIDLYSVPIAGPHTQSAKLNPCGQVFVLSAYAVSQDGQRIVINGDDCDGGGILRSLPITGGPSVRLTPGGETRFPQYKFITDDQRFVVYSLAATVNQQTLRDLYIAPLNGPSTDIHLVQSGAVPGINPTLVGDAPNGEWLAFTALNSMPTGAPTALYLAARTGTTNAPRLVTSNYPNETYAAFSADSRYLIYREVGGTFMSLDVAAGSSPVSLGLPADQYSSVLWNSPAERLVIRSHADGYLYSVPPAGPASALIRITHAPVHGYSGPKVTPDGQQVVYISDEDDQLYVTDVGAAYSAPTPVFQMPQGCGNGPAPTLTAGPTRTPFPTEYPLFLPVLKQCAPEP